MDSGGAEPNGSSRNPTLRCIASGRRRVVLGYLLDRGSPVTVQALATTLAATGQGKPITDVATADVRAIRTGLAHTHLPALEDASLVTWDRADETVTTTSHPVYDDPRFRRLLAVDADGFDEALSVLSHERRRIALTVLRDAGTPMARSELARKILHRETGTNEPETATDDPDSAAVEDVVAALYHLHLPRLADADFVEYERESGHATYADHPALEATLEIIYEPDEHLVEKFDGFLGGLGASYRQSRDVGDSANWPHFWGDPHHG